MTAWKGCPTMNDNLERLFLNDSLERLSYNE